MTRLAVIGGTGYAGAHIIEQAKAQGIDVVSYSRSTPEAAIEGVEYRTGDFTDRAVASEIVADADVVVITAAPRGDMVGRVETATAQIADLAAASGTRLGVVGGAGSLYAYEGGPQVFDTDGFPDAIQPEAREAARMLDALRERSDDLDWFYISPAGGFGAFAPGEALGRYRTGGDVLVTDDAGESFISGADFGLAVADEVARPAHRGTRFTVAY
ncbi:NAD(P)-dependent oxidoreductase [Microbacterium halophytorum]|uniref:NAD(P)-dependent oxidoreductase n=1 Tax=Microbacterium halophytorum TaxID=2067568 RepID=UPI000CFE1953|nr:NAD(P)H-binding protein [Microbacterium halophytorum]